jgi:hypothetical protein
MEGVPNLVQASFRGREDDGNEADPGGASWIDITNNDWTQLTSIVMAPRVHFRVRFLIQETAGVASDNFEETLYFQVNGIGAYLPVAAAAGWPPPADVTGILSGHYADGDDTTQQIGAGAFISPNSGMVEGDGGPASTMLPDFAGNDEVEFEFCLELDGTSLNDGDIVRLRVYNDGNPINSYTNTPEITVSIPMIGSRRIFVIS